VGVWGRKERAGHVLRDLDRIELVRPLNVDPKEARRVRYRAHGEKLPRGIQRSKPR
jgi:putative ubiquitin-RnfH superfamily antitoxin RatB of RatAB toxin-antitoxin module